MNIFEVFIKLIEKYNPWTTQAPCGTIVTKLPFEIKVSEGKEIAKFNSQIGKLYWPSDGSEADGPGIRDIPNKYERKRRNKAKTPKRNK